MTNKGFKIDKAEIIGSIQCECGNILPINYNLNFYTKIANDIGNKVLCSCGKEYRINILVDLVE